ncbi:hypothetical protein D4R49_00790 [bacterium]|nr:MAG: hypothetical protein D4R49_00790 [bacterium]
MEAESLDQRVGTIPPTVKLGTYENARELRDELVAKKIHLDRFTSFALNEGIPIARQTIEFGTLRCTIANLGFSRGGYFKEVYHHFLNLGGIQFYPAEFAMLLRLNYLDQPVGERLWVLTESVRSSGHKGRLSLDHDRHEGLSICGHIGPDQIPLGPQEEIVIPVVHRRN